MKQSITVENGNLSVSREPKGWADAHGYEDGVYVLDDPDNASNAWAWSKVSDTVSRSSVVAKHTEGPWTALKLTDMRVAIVASPNPRNTYDGIPQNSAVVALVEPLPSGHLDMDTARLIASAPALLKRLKATLTALEAHLEKESKQTGVPIEDVCPCATCEVVSARETIARAEGRE